MPSSVKSLWRQSKCALPFRQKSRTGKHKTPELEVFGGLAWLLRAACAGLSDLLLLNFGTYCNAFPAFYFFALKFAHGLLTRGQLLDVLLGIKIRRLR